MVSCDDRSQPSMAGMDKTLEDFLMPPPNSTPISFVLRNSAESLRDASSSTLDRSNNSSSTSGSWNSSCSCHSMSSLSHGAKSAFVFHRQPILPPLLCSSSRTEMKVYKMKAVEKEQRKKQKEKERLISRVEAILSNVEISPARNRRFSKPPAHSEQNKKIEEEDSSHESASTNDEIHDDRCDDVIHFHDNKLTDTSSIEGNTDTNDGSLHKEEIVDETMPTGDNIVGPDRNRDRKESESCDDDQLPGDSDDVVSFHDNAYRSSLRNLLQKSISLNGSGKSPVNTKVSNSEPSESKPSSESEEENTENTVIDAKLKPVSDDEQSLEIEESAPKSPKQIKKSEDLSENEETLVESIVETVLKEATMHLLKENNDETLLCDVTENQKVKENMAKLPNETVCNKNLVEKEISSWDTPKIAKTADLNDVSPVSVTNSQFFELHNQSTSTKVNFPIGGSKEHEVRSPKTVSSQQHFEPEIEESPILPTEKSSDMVELTGAICYDHTANGVCQDSMATTTEAYPVAIVTDASDDDLTLLQPVMSQTIAAATPSLRVDHLIENDKEGTKENRDPAMETGSLHSLKRSLSFTLDQPSRAFESAVIEAVSQHFQGLQQDKSDSQAEFDSVRRNEEVAEKKKKKMLNARVRRGSYNLDEPSPFLVKNKESLTIEPEEFDGLSEMTLSTENDVKRKLDLPSDSEESSIPASTKKQMTEEDSTTSKAELNVANLCRLLQDQHKQQMETMKRKHQEQLKSLQKELIQGQNKMSVPLDRAIAFCHDVTVSPSLTSTEYRDIRIGGRHYEEYPPEYPEPDEPYPEMIVYQNVDISRITDVELTPTLHDKLCKFSALCKGHLTRQLLKSNKVQEILQIIRDTSRLILSLRSEVNESKGMDSVRDTYLEDRLYTQLRSALSQLHNIFFNISTAERMYIVAQSCILEKLSEKKSQKPHKLSAATQKSLERKRLLSTNSDPAQHPAVTHAKNQPREVKSKISHIWKTDPVKQQEKKSPTPKLSSKGPVEGKKFATLKHTVQSQYKTKYPVASQSRTMTSQGRNMTSSQSTKTSKDPKITTTSRPEAGHHKSKSPVISQSSRSTSQTLTVTSQRKYKMPQTMGKSTSQSSKVNQQKPTTKKTAPLANRGNIRQ